LQAGHPWILDGQLAISGSDLRDRRLGASNFDSSISSIKPNSRNATGRLLAEDLKKLISQVPKRETD
jgi:hypothetical protein